MKWTNLTLINWINFDWILVDFWLEIGEKMVKIRPDFYEISVNFRSEMNWLEVNWINN